MVAVVVGCVGGGVSDDLGVVLLELLTGMKPIQFGKNIVREVKRFPP